MSKFTKKCMAIRTLSDTASSLPRGRFLSRHAMLFPTEERCVTRLKTAARETNTGSGCHRFLC